MLRYLRMKVETEDWHGVSDAANDLRELEAQFPQLRKSEKCPPNRRPKPA
jgi:hypothetical protein